MFALHLLVARTEAACTFQTIVPELDAALTAAEQAYVSLDVAEFQRASTELDLVLPCLAEPTPAGLVVRLHRLRGLGMYADGRPDDARSALLAARSLDPAYVFPEDVLPTGFELRTLYEGLPTLPAETVRLPRPAKGDLWFDGQASAGRPADRATLYQRAERGIMAENRYLLPTDAVPPYPGAHRTQGIVLVSAAVTGAASAALYGLALQGQASLDPPDPAWTVDDLRQLQTRTNALAGVAIGLAVAGAGQTVLALTALRPPQEARR